MTRSIERLLIANRGEIAARVIRTARAMGIGTAVVFSDADAALPYVREAHVAVRLPGTAAHVTYLDPERLLDAAARTGADAVHPGYGFLSENAAFAQRVLDAGLVWVGPPPAAIATMGDKLAALATMDAAGVPTLPRAALPVGGNATTLAAAVELVGLPLLVKASMGGGGKGMRVVRDADELGEAVAAARREAQRAFGDGTVYVERFVEPARHVEIQVLADDHGAVVDLFERECSIQRRHQKVLEESPAPSLDADLRHRMGEAARAAAAAVGYRGAGTVEFVLESTGAFWFLEMNTRLQVEHPVTELVTGVDLVRQQLLVAQGLPLDLPERRLDGAAIEVRLYAEDPADDFLPASGRILRWEPPAGVRVDSGVEQGVEVSSHYDPMLAKLVAHAPTRRDAAARLAGALDDLRVHGPATNRAFLARVLRHPAFLAGDTTTDFIGRFRAELTSPPEDGVVRRAAVAAALAGRLDRLAADRDRLPIPPGWRNNRAGGLRVGFDTPVGRVDLEHHVDRAGVERVAIDGEEVQARVHAWDGATLDLEIGTVRRPVAVTRDGVRWWVQDGRDEVLLRELPRLPRPVAAQVSGSLGAPMNGVVVSVNVAVGDLVEAGDTLVVIEAMKMEHRVLARCSGSVGAVLVAAGRTVSTGEPLVVVQPAGDEIAQT